MLKLYVSAIIRNRCAQVYNFVHIRDKITRMMQRPLRQLIRSKLHSLYLEFV